MGLGQGVVSGLPALPKCRPWEETYYGPDDVPVPCHASLLSVFGMPARVLGITGKGDFDFTPVIVSAAAWGLALVLLLKGRR